MAHSSNNGLYGSAPGHRGQSGLVHVEDSYFNSNNIANVRLGSSAGTSHVRNTTIHVDDSVNGCETNCSSPGAVNARGVWAWDGPVELHDWDVKTGSYGSALATRDGGSIEQNDSRIGSAADTSPPEGVPTSAEEAASASSTSSSDSGGDGSSSSGDSSSSGTLLEFVSADDAADLRYEFTVEGNVRKRTSGTDSGYVAESGDSVTDNGDGTVTVSGDAAKSADLGSVQGGDAADGGDASGEVWNGRDGFRFSGEITQFSLEGSTVVEVQDGS
ncbi:hypothetical protein [Halorussus caseinilyticus]|uniref:Pectate lyase n=1 Tax=Halorussus caseinilyticus TaxID=3034025 RepID=A0ABD5WLK2_9EURY